MALFSDMMDEACEKADEIVRLRLELSGLTQRAEAFRAAVVESGALNHVPQSKYFVPLRRLEQALEMLRSHQQQVDPNAKA